MRKRRHGDNVWGDLKPGDPGWEDRPEREDFENVPPIYRHHEQAQFLLSRDEITALAVAVAKGVEPTATPTTATEASQVVWRTRFDTPDRVSPTLCSLMTMLAEGTYGLD